MFHDSRVGLKRTSSARPGFESPESRTVTTVRSNVQSSERSCQRIMQTHHTRREFLTASGAALGVTLAGGRVRAREPTHRYLVDLRRTGSDAVDGLDVVHPLDGLPLAVVRATPSAVAPLRAARDRRFTLEPTPGPDHEPPTLPPVRDLQWNARDQSFEAAHDHATGRGARVAVVDSGVFDGHPALAGRVNWDLSRDFTDGGGTNDPPGNSHGTMVAGVVAATGAEDGPIGVAPNAELVDCRVFSGATARFTDVVAAILHAADVGCDVANLSLGAYPLSLSDPAAATFVLAYELAAAYAAARGTLLVASAGNDRADLDADGMDRAMPAEATSVMAVGATGPRGFVWDDPADVTDPMDHLRAPATTPAVYTNYGQRALSVSAPGGNVDSEARRLVAQWYLDGVPSTAFVDGPDGREPTVRWGLGTSFAAPHVAGAAALVAGEHPDADPLAVRRHLESTARDAGRPAFRGSGHLDTLAAVTTPLTARRSLPWERWEWAPGVRV